MRWSFRTNGNYVDFVHTDETSEAVESTIFHLHNTSRCVSWSLPSDTTRINFTIDENRYANILITDVDFDGTAMNSQDDFETGITGMFAGLASGGGGVTNITYANLVTAINGATLSPGTTYKITDRGDRGLFFQAISTTQLAKDGTRLMLCPARYSSNETLGGNVWKGVWNIGKSVDADDLMIWGGLVWQNLTGDIGTAPDEISLDGTNWAVIPKASFSNGEYVEIPFGVRYDVANDWIERQWDGAGNEFGIDFVSEVFEGIGYNFCDVSDWNFSAQLAGEVLFNNRTIGVFNNSCGSIHDNTCGWVIQANSNTLEIANNTNSQGIENNSNAGEIGRNSNNGSIYGNSNGSNIILNNNNGPIQNNSNTGVIESNSNNGAIQNIGSANGDIKNNINNGVISTTTTGDITDTVVNK